MPAAPLVLGIETSCDDTACAILDGAGRILASEVSSQLAAHRPYGGVVPEIASREHLRNWPPVSAAALARAGVTIAELGGVAATRGPGLVGALLVGLSLGKAIAFARGVPFCAVHHLEGHLYSPFLDPGGQPAAAIPERFAGLVVSGGHTSLFAVAGSVVTTLGETRDDAMGEVFDKIGKRIGLAYPQGPRVDELAERGDASRFRFAVPACSEGATRGRGSGGSLDFSYSGLKSQAILELDRLGIGRETRADDSMDSKASEAWSPPAAVLDLLAGFRAAAVAQLVDRLDLLAAQAPIETLAVSGGVAANRLLRRELAAWSARRGVDLRLVDLALAGDNAAMIAHAGLLRLRRGDTDDPRHADAASRLPL